MLTSEECGRIRGFCYGWKGSQEEIERDMGYARRLALNSTRIWLRYQEYYENPKEYIEKLRNFIRTAYRFGITTMPVIFNGNMIDISILGKDWRGTGEAYSKGIVETLMNEEGIIMWDIMNEPTANEYSTKNQDPDQRQRHLETLWDFYAISRALSKALTVKHL